MSIAKTLSRWLRIAFSLSALAIMLMCGSTAFGQSKPSADRIRQIDRMIDAMASRNKQPRIEYADDGYQAFALFSPDFDWSDQDRVWKAIRAVREDKSDEMWWRLRSHIADKRYSLTVDFDVQTHIWNITVGEFCRAITEANLNVACAKHLPNAPGFMPFSPSTVFDKNEKNWTGRPLYELQIEVCREAIKEWKSLKSTMSSHADHTDSPSHTFTAEEKAKFADAVKEQIEELKRTKKAVSANRILLHGFDTMDHFNAESAKRMRTAYEGEKSKQPKDMNEN